MSCTYPANKGILTVCVWLSGCWSADRNTAAKTYGTQSSDLDQQRLRRPSRFLFRDPIKKLYKTSEEDVNFTVKKDPTHEGQKGRKGGIRRSTDVQTAWGIYLRGLQSDFSAWRKRVDSVWLVTSKWICKECVLLWKLAWETSCIYVTYRMKDVDGCSLHWAHGLMVITSLVFLPFLAHLPFSVLTFFSCHTGGNIWREAAICYESYHTLNQM